MTSPISFHLMHALPLLYPSPCTPSPYFIPPHAHSPPILFHPMHTFPLFYPSPCTPSPYSIPVHAHPPPILSHPMHTLPPTLFRPMHALYLSHPMHALCLFYPIHALFLFSPSPHKPPQYSILLQLMHVLTPCHIHLEGIFSFGIWICHLWICSSAHTEYIIIIYLA